MARLTLDVSDDQQKRIKILAAKSGTTIKDFVLSRIPEINESSGNKSLRQAMEEFEKIRVNLKSGRGDLPWRELAHDGHQ